MWLLIWQILISNDYLLDSYQKHLKEIVLRYPWSGSQGTYSTPTMSISPLNVPPVIVRLNRSSVQLKVLYNLPVLYNVSVVKMSPCEQRVHTINKICCGECHTCT